MGFSLNIRQKVNTVIPRRKASYSKIELLKKKGIFELEERKSGQIFLFGLPKRITKEWGTGGGGGADEDRTREKSARGNT